MPNNCSRSALSIVSSPCSSSSSSCCCCCCRCSMWVRRSPKIPASSLSNSSLSCAHELGACTSRDTSCRPEQDDAELVAGAQGWLTSGLMSMMPTSTTYLQCVTASRERMQSMQTRRGAGWLGSSWTPSLPSSVSCSCSRERLLIAPWPWPDMGAAERVGIFPSISSRWWWRGG